MPHGTLKSFTSKIMNDYKPLEQRAIEAGVSRELAHLMYNVARDAEGHGWSEELKDWAGDWNKMISLALAEPEKMKDVCSLLFASAGLDYMEGLKDIGFSKEKSWKLLAWILPEDYEADEDEEINICDPEPEKFDPEKMAYAISLLQKDSLHKTSSSAHVCRQFLEACQVKAEIDFADLDCLDWEERFAVSMIFQGMLWYPEETVALVNHLVTQTQETP